MIDELIVGNTYTLNSGHKMKVIDYIPKRKEDRYSSDSYKVEVDGKIFIHSISYLKHLQYREVKND